jgi:hypothetical protein
VIGVALVSGWDIKIHIILRSLVAGHVAVAPGFDINLTDEFVSILNLGGSENTKTSLVSKYYNDWWKDPQLPTAPPDHIPPAVFPKLLNKDNIHTCLAFDKERRAKWEAPPKKHPTSFPRYTWHASAQSTENPAGCGKCNAYRSVACSSFEECMNLNTQVDGMRVIFETRWHESVRRAAAFHELYIAAIRKEEDVPAFAAPAVVGTLGSIPAGPLPIVPTGMKTRTKPVVSPPAPSSTISMMATGAGSSSARARGKRAGRGRGKAEEKRAMEDERRAAAEDRRAAEEERRVTEEERHAATEDRRLAAEERRAVAAIQFGQWQALPVVQWSHGANLTNADLAEAFGTRPTGKRIHSGYEVSLTGGGFPPWPKSPFPSLPGTPTPSEFSDVEVTRIPDLAPDIFPYNYHYPPLAGTPPGSEYSTPPIRFVGTHSAAMAPYADSGQLAPSMSEADDKERAVLQPDVMSISDPEDDADHVVAGICPEVINISDDEPPQATHPAGLCTGDSAVNTSKLEPRPEAIEFSDDGGPEAENTTHRVVLQPDILLISDDEERAQFSPPNSPKALLQPEILEISDDEQETHHRSAIVGSVAPLNHPAVDEHTASPTSAQVTPQPEVLDISDGEASAPPVTLQPDVLDISDGEASAPPVTLQPEVLEISDGEASAPPVPIQPDVLEFSDGEPSAPTAPSAYPSVISPSEENSNDSEHASSSDSQASVQQHLEDVEESSEDTEQSDMSEGSEEESDEEGSYDSDESSSDESEESASGIHPTVQPYTGDDFAMVPDSVLESSEEGEDNVE